MGAAKKNIEDNDSILFNDLAKEIEKNIEPVDLQSKVLAYQVTRASKREVVTAAATIFDKNELVLSKAELKNISPDGLSFEVLPFDISPNDQVYVHFGSLSSLGMVLCTVQWTGHISSLRKDHKMIGLKFNNLSPIKQKLLQDFLQKLKIKSKNDPIYVD